MIHGSLLAETREKSAGEGIEARAGESRPGKADATVRRDVRARYQGESQK
jgi:hypothetical protein